MKTKNECGACYVARRWRESADCRAKMSAAHRRFMDKYRTRQDARRYAKYFIDPLTRLAGVSNRNAKGRGRDGHVSATELALLFPDLFHDFQATTCPFCGTIVVVGGNASVDHIEPDGLHEQANVRIVCVSCNSSRGRLNDVDYIAKLATNDALRAHIHRRNQERLGAFLISRYVIPLPEVEAIVARIKATA